LYFLIGIPASLQSEFSLTPAGTKNPGQVTKRCWNLCATTAKSRDTVGIGLFSLPQIMPP